MIHVDKIYIIAFPGDAEKKKERWLKELQSVPLHAPVEIYEVPEEAGIQQVLLKESLRLTESWPLGTSASLTGEEISLAIGHWNVWQKAMKENLHSILVLEENFIAQSNHYHVLNTREPWEVIYLGRMAFAGDIPLKGGLVSPGYSHGSFAYLINRNGIQKLTQSGYDRQIIPVCEFLSVMQGTYPGEEVSTLFSGRLNILATMKNLIEQDVSLNSVVETAVSPEGYQPRHPLLFDAFGDAAANWVKKYVNLQLVQKEFDLICDEPIDNVYCFPLFTPLFCKEIIEEAEHYGQWTNYRHKDHPPIDIMLNSFGFNEIYSRVLREYLYPLFYHKYQLQGEILKNLISQNFVVRYLAEQQGHLGLHNDGSHISMIVTLNTDFEGGGTIFPKFKKLIKHEQPGYASIHPGFIGYLHGARPVTKGKRYILASFFFLE